MRLFYAPIFLDADTYSPGMDDGSGSTVSAIGELPPGTRAAVCDQDGDRFVIEAPDDFGPLLGWSEKTKSEVNTDYPGLIP